MNYCALLASGTGTRMGKTYLPKQFIDVNGHPLIYYVLETIIKREFVDKIYVGVSEQYLDLMHEIINSFVDVNLGKKIKIVIGAQERMGTFENIMKSLLSSIKQVTDDNRPLISKDLYFKCFDEARKYGVACPARPFVDGVCRVLNDNIIEIPSKIDLFSFQTPECFRLSDYIRITQNNSLLHKKFLGIAELFLSYGIAPHIVIGNDQCFKVTTPIDFELLETYIAHNIDNISITDECDLSELWIQQQEEVPYVLFGYSGAVSFICENLKKIGITIQYIIDNDEHKQGLFFNEIPIISFEQLIETKKRYVIIITAYNPKFITEIKKQVTSSNIYSKVDFVECFYPIGIQSKNEIMANIVSINKVYHLLSDQKSKEVYTAKINYIITKNSYLLKNLVNVDQYFDMNILGSIESGAMIDGGSFDGEDAIKMSKINKTAPVFCFEIDSVNCEKIQKRIAKHNNIKLVHAGLFVKTTTLMMTKNSGSKGAHLFDANTNQNDEYVHDINVIAIDDFFEKQKVSFIKMDIEGSEYDAILGARKIIKRDHPKLAICIYHSIEDHWQIPLLVKHLYPNYNIYIRHYHDLGIETVMYAV